MQIVALMTAISSLSLDATGAGLIAGCVNYKYVFIITICITKDVTYLLQHYVPEGCRALRKGQQWYECPNSCSTRIAVWYWCNACIVSTYTGHMSNSFYIRTAMSPDGKYIASGSKDHNVYLWEVCQPRGVTMCWYCVLICISDGISAIYDLLWCIIMNQSYHTLTTRCRIHSERRSNSRATSAKWML